LINNRPVGLWMLPAHVGASRSLLAALQREFNRLRTLEHPNIARMLELGSNGQQYYVTGERLDGEPLRDVLTHLMPERLDVGEADDIVRAIGSALAYAHEREIAHGDVRAENVIVTMDRRFMLTNFLARRVAKVSGRPPRPSDDLKGLARLAAELYTGSTSPQALRAAAHGAIPAARLNAIRAVLEGSGRRAGSVAEFLDLAGLALSDTGATLRRPQPPTRWRLALPMYLWRLVLPMAAVAAIASLIAAYRGDVAGDVAASADELKVRGLDALRAVAARVTPADAPGAAADDGMTQQAAAPTAEAAPPPAATPRTPEAHGAALPHGAEAVHETETPRDAPAPAPEERPQAPPPRPASTAAARPTNKSPPPQHELPAVSLDVPKIAAREDHSVVAIDVVRSGDTTKETRVIWWTTPDTAREEDDYARTGRQILTFPPGATVERVLIPIVDDGVREPTEMFTLHLAQPQGGVAGAVTTTRVTLYDDD
jgi:serine/threonine-protein kinase